MNGYRPELIHWYIAGYLQSVHLLAMQPLPFCVKECSQITLTRAQFLRW